MRRLRPLALVVFCAAGCGLDIVGVAVTPNDAGPLAAEASVPDIDAAGDPDDAADANPCALCPAGTPRTLCVEGACQPTRRVFITSIGFAANFGGVEGADARCLSVASSATLGGAWKAWIGYSAKAPRDRLENASAAYRLLDGTLIAATGAQLFPFPSISHGIDLDEHRQAAPTSQFEVWTGTMANGDSVAGQDCRGWTSSSMADVGVVGVFDNSSMWTYAYDQTCERTGQHLYCFEQ